MNDFVELRKIIVMLLRRWWVLLLLMVMTAAAAYFYSVRQTPIYQAKTSILVGNSIQTTDLDNRDIQTSELLAYTYADIARRQPVLNNVVEALNLDMEWQQLRPQVRAGLVSGTQLLEITVEDESPALARQIADEVAKELIVLSPTELQNQELSESQAFVQQELTSLEDRILTGQKRLGEVQEAMTRTTSIDELDALQDEANRLQRLITDWESNYTKLVVFVESQQSPNYLSIIEPAQASKSPVRPRTQLNTLLGALIGLILAAAGVFLYESMRDTVRTSDEIVQNLGVSLLGEIGHVKQNGIRWGLITAQDPFASAAEAFRNIRSRISFRNNEKPMQSILLTSATDGEGKTLTVANLAIVIANAGIPTIIVDANVRTPVQHKIFKANNNAGWANLIRNEALNSVDLLVDTAVENLRLLPSGNSTNPSEFLNRKAVERVIDQLGPLAEVVIFDSSSVLNAAETLILAGQVDGVGLVIESNKVGQADLKRVVLGLQESHANLIGAILNKPILVYGWIDYISRWFYKFRPQPDQPNLWKPLAARESHDKV